MMRAIEHFLEELPGLTVEDQAGQGLVEYAMLIMFVVIACVGALSAFANVQQAMLWNLIVNGLRSAGLI
jgi:Flp pilus assembly pilin Flp